jgi:hypothetical protein
MVDHAVVEALLQRLYLGGGSPRNEERKKAREVADLLAMLARAIPQPAPRGKARVLVDAAAGHGYVGLCAAALLGWRRVVAIERDPDRVARVRAAAAGLDVELETRVGTLGEGGELVPARADVVLALHACGPATDGVVAGALAAEARWLLCVPCCYGAAVEGWADAEKRADALGLAADAEVRARHAAALIDSARLRRLRDAGYDAKLVAFTAPTVTPHNLVFRARRGGRA